VRPGGLGSSEKPQRVYSAIAQQRRDLVEVVRACEPDHLCPRTLVSRIRIGTEYRAANCSGVIFSRLKPQSYLRT
jgi:hypothetical protein